MNDVSPYIREQIDKLSQPGRVASHYAVCYMWGTAGILYNKAFVPDADAESWSCLWDRKYAGKILMKDSYRDAYGTAIIYAHARDLAGGKGDSRGSDERLFSPCNGDCRKNTSRR